MALDTRPAEPLTSRQIAKLIAGLMCSLVHESGAEAVTDALNHLVEHQGHYNDTFKNVESLFKDPPPTRY
jgi:hypothetical protein